MADEQDNALPGHLELLAIRIAHHMRPARMRPVTFALGVGVAPLIGHRANLLGWAIVESTGAAAAALSIVNGTSAGSPALAPVNVGSAGYAALMVGSPGILADAGLSVVVTAGAVNGVLFYELLS